MVGDGGGGVQYSCQLQIIGRHSVRCRFGRGAAALDPQAGIGVVALQPGHLLLTSIAVSPGVRIDNASVGLPGWSVSCRP